MKSKIFTLLMIVLFFGTGSIFAQIPQGINYQAVVRNANGTIAANAAVTFRFTFLELSANGANRYQETKALTTDSYGMASHVLGTGTATSGSFAAVNWTKTNYLKTEVNLTGNYVVIGTEKFQSVPYALNAGGGNWTLGGNDISNANSGKVTVNSKLSFPNVDAGKRVVLWEEANGAYCGLGKDPYTTTLAIAGDQNYFSFIRHDGPTPFEMMRLTGYGDITMLGNMTIKPKTVYVHGDGQQDFGSGGLPFIMASAENNGETGGIYGDGNAVTIWSPGDANGGQPSALLYVCDEDSYDGDGNPYNNGGLMAYLNTSGNWVAPSDIRRKENIVPITGALEKITQIKGYSYNFKISPEEAEKGDVPQQAYGVIAQELEQVIPGLVEKSESNDYYVSYTEFTPFLIEAIKEQQVMIETLKAEMTAMKAEMAAMKK